ncbi:phosphatase PAP2 family protein [Sinomonas notoginsengisoli]|uniref:phosphatase PAP2 family protein n=1 Tax=Sinomonas notoginsengisoli TaxID=1457311 RepID=UPI001F28B300|nr:phosphatase PAP2 family protein [Sinomonas notoginsengisoli]
MQGKRRPLQRVVEGLARWLGPHASMWTLLALGLALSLGFSWAGGEVYESVVEKGSLAAMDQPVLAEAVALRSPSLDAAVTAFTNLAGGVAAPIIAVVAMVVLAVWMRHWRPLVLVPAAGVGSLLMTLFGKQLAGRARPPLDLAVPPYEYSASFPSGHTLNATVIAGVVVYLICLRLRRAWARAVTITVGGLYASAVGFSRVFLGHHWLTDVIAGWLLGCAWLTVVIVAHQVFHLVRHSRSTPGSAKGAHDGGGELPPSSSSRPG